jgi:hypothetical protein
MFVYGYLLITPFASLFGIRSIYFIGIVSILIAFAILYKYIIIKKWFIYISFTILLLVLPVTIYWLDIRFLVMPIFLWFALFLIQSCNNRCLDKFVDYSTKFMIFLLIGSVIAFILSKFGIKPIWSIVYPDGRTSYLYYTSFALSIFNDGVIRAGAIFDEPGTFSMFIALLAAIRRLMGKDEKTTWIMLFMGFITFSLAHLIFVIFYFISFKHTIKQWMRIISGFIIFVVLLFSTGAIDDLNKRLLNRLVLNEEGRLNGDNRSLDTFKIIEELSLDPINNITFGISPDCKWGGERCPSSVAGLGGTPLSLISQQGLLASIPLYGLMFLGFIAPIFGRKYFVLFGVSLLLLQRPYLFSVSYSLMIALVYYLFYLSLRTKKRNIFYAKNSISN